MILTKGDLKVEFEYIGEGYCEDYDPTDPDDVQLLRFSVYQDNEQLDNGSYCTLMPADTPKAIIDHALRFLMREVENSLEGGSFKRAMEYCSWMEPADFAKDGDR